MKSGSSCCSAVEDDGCWDTVVVAEDAREVGEPLPLSLGEGEEESRRVAFGSIVSLAVMVVVVVEEVEVRMTFEGAG